MTVNETIDALYRAYTAGERLDYSTLDATSFPLVWHGLEDRVIADARRNLIEAFGVSVADVERMPERQIRERKWRRPRQPDKRRQQAIDAMGGKCQECGHDGSERVLCLHHVEGTIPGGRQREETIWLEALINPERFSLLCERCHLAAHGGSYAKPLKGRAKANA